MVEDYKFYARELYKIKLAILGDPKNDDVNSLLTFLTQVNELRPQLRREYEQLAKEYLAMSPNSLPSDSEHTAQVNELYLIKLAALAMRVKRKARSGMVTIGG